MKNCILYGIASILILFASCSNNDPEDNNMLPVHTKGIMGVEVITDGAQDDDYVHTVRFIVFDNASTSPSLDINEITNLDQQYQDASTFKANLKVSCNSDKMLIVVINEPATLTPLLMKMKYPQELEDLKLLMADAFNTNYTSPSGKGLPMTGVKRNISVEESHNSLSNPAVVSMSVERSVARVELWLKKNNLLNSAEVNTHTKITLSRSHNQGYLITGTVSDHTRYQVGPDAIYNFGHMMTVQNPSQTLVWQYTDSSPKTIGTSERLICGFYVPERTSSAALHADKLKLTIEGVSSSSGVKEGETILEQFYDEGGTLQTVDVIKRNNVYAITATLTENKVSFESTVLPWKDAKQEIIIDPVYYLRVSKDRLYMPDNGDTFTIHAETNYDRSDRGFPKGIQLTGEIRYYAQNGTLLTPSDGDKYGWLTSVATGNDGDLSRNITFTVTNDLSTQNKGCFAKTEVKAGNFTLVIKVTR